MATPVVSTNILPLRSPFRLHGLLQLILAVALVLLGWRAWPAFYQNYLELRRLMDTANADPQPVLVARTMVQALGFLLAAWFVLKNAFSGLHRLLSFFIPVGVPGELGQAGETSRQLFVQRVFGHFDRRTSLADKALVRLTPRMMYLTNPGMKLLRATSSWFALLWCGLAFFVVSLARPEMDWPWGVLAVVVAAKVIYAVSLVFLTPPQPGLQVTEDRQHFENTGNPANFYNHLEKIATEQRHEAFPNRIYLQKAPDLTNVQPNVTSTFEGGFLFETQPLPAPRAGRIPALLLGCAAVAAGLGAAGMLLFVPDAPPAELPPPWILGWLLTAITLAAFAGRFFARALDLLQVFRFESHLVWLDLKGSFASSSIGVGDGRGGQFYAERRSIQSDTHVTSYGAKIITEASGANALRAPRIVVNTTTDEKFTTMFVQLLGAMPTFKDSTSTLPTIAFDKGNVKEILQANLAVTEGMAQATARSGLPAGASPAVELPAGAAPPALPASDDSEMKDCPECGEKVRAAARKCRFCNYRFDGATVE